MLPCTFIYDLSKWSTRLQPGLNQLNWSVPRRMRFKAAYIVHRNRSVFQNILYMMMKFQRKRIFLEKYYIYTYCLAQQKMKINKKHCGYWKTSKKREENIFCHSVPSLFLHHYFVIKSGGFGTRKSLRIFPQIPKWQRIQ